ncbi:hypothetical protein [Mycobacterium intracellulare]|uniref:hypothetical protein n=1 Tax=Mycobacterium intracellulare TaxID=1767 RepID=UPI001CDA0724|nr:hypothetical protein [Mycobacterium intracellulare]MCA2307186.1 hypothetical protein [Mycobacterium intracellulare]MCA2349499.1 hypothetical protein [Mycobacterium intracellulare]UEB26953.1 hypothetical protein LK403_12700 [Mycobacterium intracellulare]UGU03940.1 hypothetical protein LTS63_09740 [Mycobacterium intracellulare]
MTRTPTTERCGLQTDASRNRPNSNAIHCDAKAIAVQRIAKTVNAKVVLRQRVSAAPTPWNRAYRQRDASAVLKAAENLRYYRVLVLIAATGLRRG